MSGAGQNLRIRHAQTQQNLIGERSKVKSHSIAKEDNDIIGEESQEDNENSDNVSDNNDSDDVLRPPSEDENVIENVDFSVFLE